MRRSFALTASVLFVALAWCVPLFGLEPDSDISQYAHTSWKIRDGFLQGFILSIAQTPDGYLWLGTERGLFRFDGIRATPWPSLSKQQLPSSYVAALLAARDGTLWIGTGKGLASWKTGKLIMYPQLAGQLVQALREDDEGTLWAGGFAYTPPGTLCAIRNSTAHCFGGNGRFGNGVLGLYEDSSRNLWAGGLNGFWRWKPGPPLFYAIAGEPYGIQHFAEDRDGSLLIPIAGGIARLRNGEIKTAYRLPSTKHPGSGERILRDRDGALWVGTWSQGLVHFREGSADSFAQRDGLSGNLVTALFEDREGNIWVGTTKGLDRFGVYSATTFSEQQGLSGGGNASVLAARDGSIWFSPHSQLYRFDRGQVTIYHRPGAGIEPTAEEGERRVREVAVVGLPGLDVVSLFQDHEGRIWVAGTGGVGYLQNDRFVSVNSVPGGVVDAMSGDSKGNLWISIVDRGLFHLFEEKLVQHIPWAALGRNDLATVLAVDPSMGGVWLGFSKGGLARLAEGQTRPSFVTDPAPDQGRVSDLQFDHEGALWVASEGGLSRIKNGRISTLTTKSGLPCDHIYWFAEDQEHSFWLYGSCGLMRIARSNLDAWLATGSSTRPKSVRATLFDETDGVTLRGDPSAGPQGRSAISPDGKIWFPTVDGLSVIDPHHLTFNPIPPPVHIEKIVADGKEYDLSGGLRLPAHVRNLSMDYTALSLVVPEKVHFKVKLEGQDNDWRELVNVRHVEYTNLAPRTYRFRVIACNNSGLWNETGDSFEFSIAPAYWQTNWFRALSVLMLLAMFWTAYHLRVRAFEQRQSFLERHQTEIRALNEQMIKAQEAERTRISGELHDSVLQQITSVVLRLGKVKREVPPDSEAIATVGDLQKELIQIGTVIRQVSHELHPALLQESGLPEALSAYCEEFSSTRGIPVSCEADESVAELSPGAALCLYRIAQEALGNAAKYSKAKQVRVRLSRSDGQVELSVSDDGVGCAPDQISKSKGLGLINMRERALQLNGTFEFDSEPGHGTIVRATIPFRASL
ncbi:MAG: two-component regulator propeller domain-containing protein [Terracidiphilus sp.]|jgi:signal transduction histidine kinase/ligand-binding sensor domain-containing protein